jgi:predicted phosphodiesterase
MTGTPAAIAVWAQLPDACLWDEVCTQSAIHLEMPVRFAILSDVHGRRQKLASVLSDAWRRGADRLISLGDVGGDGCLALLHELGVEAVFGNYEVSSWRRLASKHRAWVQGWPPLLADNGFLAVHAVPWWPQGLRSIADFEAWLDVPSRSWRDLFPYLTHEEHLWRAVAELEVAGKHILFHGHTHRQAVWHWEPAGALRRVPAAWIEVLPGHRYVVGIGSAGAPEDEGWAAYALHDTEAGLVELVRLNQ